jgi:hypothetical protein
MRLDKFLGKAFYSQQLIIYDWPSKQELFQIPDGEYYLDHKKEMRDYKVHCYRTKSENTLVVYAKKKED